MTKIIGNQIDFFLIHDQYRNSIKSVKAYPGTDVYSDHNRLHIKVKRRSINNNLKMLHKQKSIIRMYALKEMKNGRATGLD